MRIVGRLYLLGNIQQADIGFGISLLSSGDNPQIALKECLEIVGSQVLHIGIIPLECYLCPAVSHFLANSVLCYSKSFGRVSRLTPILG